jgi:hypothetical protein
MFLRSAFIYSVTCHAQSQSLVGEFCGAVSAVGGLKLSAFVNFDPNSKTTSFVVGAGDRKYVYPGRVKYSLSEAGLMSLDRDDKGFLAYLSHLPVPLSPDKLRCNFDAKTGELRCVFDSFIHIRNILTKEKCKAPFLFGTYVNSAQSIIATFDESLDSVRFTPVSRSYHALPGNGHPLKLRWNADGLVVHSQSGLLNNLKIKPARDSHTVDILIDGHHHFFTPKGSLFTAGMKWVGR